MEHGNNTNTGSGGSSPVLLLLWSNLTFSRHSHTEFTTSFLYELPTQVLLQRFENSFCPMGCAFEPKACMGTSVKGGVEETNVI